MANPPPAQRAYPERLAHWRVLRDAGQRRERAISNARTAVFLLAGACLFAAVHLPWFPAWPCPLLVVGFVGLVLWHDAVIRARKHAERAMALYDLGLARLSHTWMGRGVTSCPVELDEHSPAADLDLFGSGSLFDLIATTRTRAGLLRLARWLVELPQRHEVLRRQEAVVELREHNALREDVALLGDDVASLADPRALAEWGAASPATRGQRELHALLAVLTALEVGAIVGAVAGLWTALWPVLGLLLQWLVARALRSRVESILAQVEAPAHDLLLLEALLARIEAQSFVSPALTELQARLRATGERSHLAIRHLRRKLELLDNRRNAFFVPVAFVLHWSQHLALAVERWRLHHGKHLVTWFDLAAELDALLAISGFAYERPHYVMPALAEGAARVLGRSVGHPLLDPALCVTNEVELGQPTRAVMVSGSNMSGKSTYLRTVGINVTLASLGAPVFAESFETSILSVGATLRIQDSLQQGASRFYAEITRLRAIVERAQHQPLLFLLDEVLAGTNSHDRRVGARAVLEGLLALGAIGLVTTHDLALTELANAVPGVRNAHFSDELDEHAMREGRLRFDYRLRDGVVTHSNALALMRAVGLQV